jgi:pimeloyl-ACP methyl ester carboxylesterase
LSTTRRALLKSAGYWGGAIGLARQAASQTPDQPPVAQPSIPAIATVRTPILEIGYEESGNPQGFPIILLHGFPDDARAWDGVTPALAAAGHRVLVPYLRGFGPTKFLDKSEPRMAEQAAIAQDLEDFADALRLGTFALAGYDWGGRAASIVAALDPDRVRAAVIVGGYLIQDVFAPPAPLAPEIERGYWYQWYFNTERGRAGLKANRGALCRLLWQLWSPGMHFTEETYHRTAASFDNPDFVDCVIHSYRHRHGNAPGEARFELTERQLARRPKIPVPTIVLHGADDGLAKPPEDSPEERAQFPAMVARRVIAGAGHFLPREKPAAVSSALLELLA